MVSPVPHWVRVWGVETRCARSVLFVEQLCRRVTRRSANLNFLGHVFFDGVALPNGQNSLFDFQDFCAFLPREKVLSLHPLQVSFKSGWIEGTVMLVH